MELYVIIKITRLFKQPIETLIFFFVSNFESRTFTRCNTVDKHIFRLPFEFGNYRHTLSLQFRVHKEREFADKYVSLLSTSTERYCGNFPPKKLLNYCDRQNKTIVFGQHIVYTHDL